MNMIDAILKKARALGASLAGIVGLDDELAARIELPASFRGRMRRGAVLVLALAHEESEPKLDWWGGLGGTEGNRRLQEISSKIKRYLADEYGIRSRVLPYHPWKGGILLKNAAALAGLGAIGANNLLITPEYGPRVRLRAMVLDLETQKSSAGQALAFSPCEGCPRPCWQACPQDAFASGSYDRARCVVQMEQDESRPPVRRDNAPMIPYIEYCRACELACPVAK
jgi:epoxyqueuosine reductase